MSTYSINISTPTESTSYKLSDSGQFDALLNRLPDNLDKLINPRDLRDVMLSLWSSVPFKITSASGSSNKYIGLDTGNPSGDRDVKNKILIGKRAFSGTFSYNPSYDILNNTLYNSDVDIFLYNTKRDNVQQTRTRVLIISGTNVGIFQNSPYIQSQVVNVPQSLSFDFINPSGDIYVDSVLPSDQLIGFGNVFINSITFSTINQLLATPSNDKVLILENSGLIWGDLTFPTVSDLGTSSEPLEIFGSPVTVGPNLINSYPIEFTDNRRASFQIGDIEYGDTFNVVPLSEMLRRMIYDYLPPTCEISIDPPFSSGFVEVGTFPTPTLTYTINKKSLPTLITGLSNMIPGNYPPIISNEYVNVTAQSQGIVISPISATSTNFTITVSDGTQSNSASTSITGIYPYFYGFSALSTMTTIGLVSLTKLVENKSDKTVDITGIGNLYFIYPSDYGTLSNIYDNLGNTMSGSFSYSTQIFSSPSGLWASEEFLVYQWNGVSQIGPPSENFQFVY
jgi:hypothetical protein